LDGNFNHRHLRTAGECPQFFKPEYFISKDQVDEFGAQIERIRKKDPKKARHLKVPDEAVDECESGHTAGSGSTVKTNMEEFNDSGLMMLRCQHDIPLFFANIDSPGEQQKYGIALLAHLFSLLPACANVVALYDVGCVLDRSLQAVSCIFISQLPHVTLSILHFHSMNFCQRQLLIVYFSPQVQCMLTFTNGHVSLFIIRVCRWD
jgi:hypothetical protein